MRRAGPRVPPSLRGQPADIDAQLATATVGDVQSRVHRETVALVLWCMQYGGFATVAGRNSRHLLSIDGVPFFTAS